MFKVTEFYVEPVVVGRGVDGEIRAALTPPRRTRDRAEAVRWAREARARLERRRPSEQVRVLLYTVTGEPMFDLWAEPYITEF